MIHRLTAILCLILIFVSCQDTKYNIERNHKLGLIFEFRVGNGKLLVCMADLDKIQDKPEGRQFYRSILEYMDSGQFKPQTSISEAELTALFKTKVKA